MQHHIVIIDGHNVINRIPRWRRLLNDHTETAGNALIQYCRHWLQQRGDVERFTIVFDGTPWSGLTPAATGGGIRILFSGVGITADQRIIELARWEATRCSCQIVSDDREIIDACRTCGAASLSCMAFAQRLRSSGDKAPSHSRKHTRTPHSSADKVSLHPSATKQINAELYQKWIQKGSGS